jgi:hypothetical protein
LGLSAIKFKGLSRKNSACSIKNSFLITTLNRQSSHNQLKQTQTSFKKKSLGNKLTPYQTTQKFNNHNKLLYKLKLDAQKEDQSKLILDIINEGVKIEKNLFKDSRQSDTLKIPCLSKFIQKVIHRSNIFRKEKSSLNIIYKKDNKIDLILEPIFSRKNSSNNLINRGQNTLLEKHYDKDNNFNDLKSNDFSMKKVKLSIIDNFLKRF